MATNSIIEKVNGTDSSENRIASTFYCTCTTAASTGQKAATVADSCVFDNNCLVTGVTVHVRFTNSNTHATPTLKVGTSSAKTIKAYGTTAPGTSSTKSWYSGSVVSFTYDGTYWVQNDYKYNDDVAVRQKLSTSNSDRPLLMSYALAESTTDYTDSMTYRSNKIYANPSTGNVQVATLNGYTPTGVWEGTQAQYDAITTYDPDTTYFITDSSSPVLTATNVNYSNVNSGLSATTVQGAIDELSHASIISFDASKWSSKTSNREIRINKYGKVVSMYIVFTLASALSANEGIISNGGVPPMCLNQNEYQFLITCVAGTNASKTGRVRITKEGGITDWYSQSGFFASGCTFLMNATYITD